MRQKTKKKAMFARKGLRKTDSDTVTKDAKIITKVKSATTLVNRSTKKSSLEILSYVTSVLRFSAMDVTGIIKMLSLLRRS